MSKKEERTMKISNTLLQLAPQIVHLPCLFWAGEPRLPKKLKEVK